VSKNLFKIVHKLETETIQKVIYNEIILELLSDIDLAVQQAAIESISEFVGRLDESQVINDYLPRVKQFIYNEDMLDDTLVNVSRCFGKMVF
jgi:hypothetical protein